MSQEKPRKRQSPAPVGIELALGNEDLLVQIFVLLPAKSLIRFKSVCQKWLSFISSDHFCRLHSLRHLKLQRSLIVQMSNNHFFSINQSINGGGKIAMIPYTLSVPNHEIRQDCYGLLLLEPTEDLKRNSVYVYNPTTKKSRKISLTKEGYVAIALAFDPSKSPHYKLVCIRSDSNDYTVEVYESESSTWKLILEHTTHAIIRNDGVYCDDSIFWSTCYGYWCFDIAKNEIRTLPFPVSPWNVQKSYCLQESNGHLYCINLLETHQSAPVSVLVSELDTVSSQWVSKYHDMLHQHYTYLDISIVRFMAGAGDGTTCRLLTYDIGLRRMMAYNFLDKSHQLLLQLRSHNYKPISRFDPAMKAAFQFGEILALV